jgi:DNA invertase Pin-like site-specific DNA recombinase
VSDAAKYITNTVFTTQEQILKIFRDETGSFSAIARKHGVSKDIVTNIKTGRRWSHITGKVHDVR